MEKTGTSPGPMCNPESTAIQADMSSLGIKESLPTTDIHTRLDLDSTSQQTADVDESDNRVTPCSGGWLYNRDQGILIKLPCKRWSCSRCARKKGASICRRLKKSGKAQSLNRLLTLPFDLKARSWEQAIRESGACLNRFMTSLKRCCSGLNYFWTREIGKKSNMVHFHILIDRFIPKILVSKLWKRAGGGSIVDIGIVRKSTSYVFKYLNKLPDYASDVWHALRNKRRYSTSRELLAPTLKDKLIGYWVFLDIAIGSSLVLQKGRTSDGLFVYSFDDG